MNCTRFERWLWDEVEGRLSAAQAEALRAHRQACPRCQRQWEVVQATYRALHTLPRHRAPEPLVAQTRARIQQASAPKPAFQWWKRVALAPALGLVVAAAWWGWLALNPDGVNSKGVTMPAQSEESWVEIHEQLEVADWSPTASYFIKTGYTR